MILSLVEQWLRLWLNILHYILILATWIYHRRYYIVYIPLTITFWLYYEIKYTSPGCTFYSGRKATRLLNGCNFIFKSYRPPIYIFSCTLQWLYMCLYNNLQLLSRLLQSNYFECIGHLRRPFYYFISKFCKLIIKSPLFKALYNSDVFIAQREIIESYGRSPIILDWYLPPWLVNKCSKCNRPKSSNGFIKTSSQRSQQIPVKSSGHNFSFISSEKSFCENFNQEPRHFFCKRLNSIDNRSMDDNLSIVDSRESSLFHAIKTSMNPLSRFSFRRKNSNAEQSKLQQNILDSLKQLNSSKYGEEFYFDDGNIRFENSEHDQFNKSEAYFLQNVSCDYNNFMENNVTRGIILILPDYNMPYNICNQHTGCICNAWDNNKSIKSNSPSCNKCVMSLYKDAHSYNKETPCLSFTKLFIADALKAGFICVEIHLNVNMGLPIHIKGHWLGMTSYPFSLYGNSISDLDCAVGRISNRYPNLSIQCVGFAGGCNILTEYLLRANDSRFIEKFDYSQKPVPNSSEHVKSFESDKKTSGFGGRGDIKHATSSDYEKSYYSSSSSSESDNEDEHMNKKSIIKKKKKKRKKVEEKFDKVKHGNSFEEIDHMDSLESDIYQEVFESIKVELPSVEKYVDRRRKGNSALIKRSKISDKGLQRSKIVEEKSKVYYNKVIHSVSCINLNLKVGSEFFHLVTAPNKKNDFIKKSFILNELYIIFKKLFYKILSWSILNYKNSCKNELRESIELLIRRIHCSRDIKKLDKNVCKIYQCCHESGTIFGNIQNISNLEVGNDKGSESNLYSLLISLHKEFNEAYLESIDNPKMVYRSSLLPVNNANWTLTIGDGYYSKCEGSNKINGLINPTDKINMVLLRRYLRKLYYDNMKLVRTCLGSIKLPVLIISSLDNSLFGVQDIDVYQPIRNSNILHLVTQSGGDCTYLSGVTKPVYWLRDPILEFIQAAIANKQEVIFH